jgi:hypothetical protein
MSTKTVANEELCEVVARKLVTRKIPFKYTPSDKMGGDFTVDDANAQELQYIIDDGVDWDHNGGAIRG